MNSFISMIITLIIIVSIPFSAFAENSKYIEDFDCWAEITPESTYLFNHSSDSSDLNGVFKYFVDVENNSIYGYFSFFESTINTLNSDISVLFDITNDNKNSQLNLISGENSNDDFNFQIHENTIAKFSSCEYVFLIEMLNLEDLKLLNLFEFTLVVNNSSYLIDYSVVLLPSENKKPAQPENVSPSKPETDSEIIDNKKPSGENTNNGDSDFSDVRDNDLISNETVDVIGTDQNKNDTKPKNTVEKDIELENKVKNNETETSGNEITSKQIFEKVVKGDNNQPDLENSKSIPAEKEKTKKISFLVNGDFSENDSLNRNKDYDNYNLVTNNNFEIYKYIGIGCAVGTVIVAVYFGFESLYIKKIKK